MRQERKQTYGVLNRSTGTGMEGLTRGCVSSNSTISKLPFFAALKTANESIANDHTAMHAYHIERCVDLHGVLGHGRLVSLSKELPHLRQVTCRRCREQEIFCGPLMAMEENRCTGFLLLADSTDGRTCGSGRCRLVCSHFCRLLRLCNFFCGVLAALYPRQQRMHSWGTY